MNVNATMIAQGIILSPFLIFIIGNIFLGWQKKIKVKHNESGIQKNCFVGYSWTYFLFGFFVPIFRCGACCFPCCLQELEVTSPPGTVVGYVVSLGPDAYSDSHKFPEGAWCKEGDWVIFGRYAGARFQIEGGDMRLLNDDEILACIDDPEAILS